MVRVLGDWYIALEVSEDDSIELGVSVDGWNEVGGVVGNQSWIGQGSQYLTTGRFTTTVVFNSIRKEDNLKNLEL